MYEYLALSVNGKLTRGTLAYSRKSDIAAELRNKQLYPLFIRGKKDKKGLSIFNFKLKSKDLITFISLFCMLLKTGITDTESIRILYQTTKNIRIKNKYRNLYNHIARGNFIYQGLKEEGFPELLVTSVRAGEENGTFLNVLNNLAGHYEREKNLKDKLRQAMIYPIILLAITIGIFILALFYIIPSFAEIFYDFEVPLPSAMRIAIHMGNFLKEYWIHLSIGLAVFIAALYFAMKMQVSRFYIQMLQLNLPIVKNIPALYITNADVAPPETPETLAEFNQYTDKINISNNSGTVSLDIYFKNIEGIRDRNGYPINKEDFGELFQDNVKLSKLKYYHGIVIEFERKGVAGNLLIEK